MKIFIHIPKTGGFSIRYCNALKSQIIINTVDKLKDYDYIQGLKFFGYPGAAHSRWKDLYPEYRDKFEAFAVVRNPWQRTASRYWHAKTRDYEVHGTDLSSFEAFIEDRHRLIKMPFTWHRPHLHWHNQLDHITNAYGKIMCHVMKTETLKKDVKNYFSVELQEKYNVTGDYPNLWTPKLINDIGDWYERDIKKFNYEPNHHLHR